MLLQSEYESISLSVARFKNTHMPLSVLHQPNMIIWLETEPPESGWWPARGSQSTNTREEYKMYQYSSRSDGYFQPGIE